MLCVRMFLAGGLLAATVAAAADGKVVGELLAADASRDQKVIVVLDDAALSPGLARRDAIRALQDRVLQGFDIGRVLNRYQTVNGFSAHMNQGEMMAMAAKGEVLRIEPMPMHQKMDAESLPLTDVDLAQADGFDGTGTVIAIIDDGIDHDHPAFGGEANFPNSKFLGGWDFADNDADPRIDCIAQSHGTAVTGVATGNGAGVTGVAPNAKVVFLKIQSAAICGSNSLDGDIVGALDWIVANKDTYGIDIVSMSFGGGNYSSVASCDGSSVAYLNAVKNAEAAGISMFAASGNSGLCDSISRPACLSPVVSVGAVYDDNFGNIGWCVSRNSCASTSPHPACTGGTRAAFETAVADNVIVYSNSASFLDITAPSTCATTADTQNGTTDCFGGTSSSTPFTAGVAAIATQAAGGTMAPATMRQLLVDSGDTVTDPKNGRVSARVNGWNAVVAASNSEPPPPPPPPPPQCDVTSVFVSGIVLGTQSVGRGSKLGTATVTLADDCGGAVSGVDVTGTFTGSFSGTSTESTNGSSVAGFLSDNTAQKKISFAFCVDDVAHAAYKAASNVVTCATQ